MEPVAEKLSVRQEGIFLSVFKTPNILKHIKFMPVMNNKNVTNEINWKNHNFITNEFMVTAIKHYVVLLY